MPSQSISPLGQDRQVQGDQELTWALHQQCQPTTLSPPDQVRHCSAPLLGGRTFQGLVLVIEGGHAQVNVLYDWGPALGCCSRCSISEHNVLCLDVSVDDLHAVHVLQGLRQLRVACVISIMQHTIVRM